MQRRSPLVMQIANAGWENSADVFPAGLNFA